MEITPNDFLYQTKTSYLDYIADFNKRLKIANTSKNEFRKIGIIATCMRFFEDWFIRYDIDGNSPSDDDNMFDTKYFYNILRVFNNTLGVDYWIYL